jgi:DNA-directed RNA polymerase subunit RPC12/RpoP
MMYCNTCGKQVPETALFCPSCGEKFEANAPTVGAAGAPPVAPVVQAPPPVAQAAPPAPPAPAQLAPDAQPALSSPGAFPSLLNLRCPKCSSAELVVLGTEGSLGKAMGVSILFGAVGNLVASSQASKDLETKPIKYKCSACHEKFVTMPHQAAPEEFLAAPCTINFERVSSFMGMAVAQIVHLNGIKIGPIKNGQTLSFSTAVRYNTLFVTDMHGLAFKGVYRFEAQPGAMVAVRFNRKFL